MERSDASLRAALKACLRERGPQDLLAALTGTESRWLLGQWPLMARDDQLPPDFHDSGADWSVWLLMAGRGAGKTRAGAEWVRARVARARETGRGPLRIALVGMTLHEARAVMVEGVSGLLAVHGNGDRPLFEPSRRLLTWPDGSMAQLFSADEPESLRGPQFDIAWCDEVAKWRDGEKAWDMLSFALRLGQRPRVVATTTPRPTPLLRRLLETPGTWISRARTADNAANLAAGFLRAMEAQYDGTRLGRQELDGELIEDDPDALFKRELIEGSRVRAAPELVRIVVAVDPPATGHARSDACGIIVAGMAENGNLYVLEDASVAAASPARWARAAVSAYHRHGADRLVAEINQGGDMVEAVIRQIDDAVAYRALRATRGKKTRAEPVAALYEQGRVRHVGALPELEDELCAFEALAGTSGNSPDRADALVWAVSELALKPKAAPRVRLL